MHWCSNLAAELAPKSRPKVSQIYYCPNLGELEAQQRPTAPFVFKPRSSLSTFSPSPYIKE